MHRALLLLCLVAGPALSDPLTPAEQVTVPRILDHVCLDLRDDWIGCEEVTLLANRDRGSADLIIRPNQNDDTGAAAIVVRDIVFNGTLFGQRPSLVAGPAGTFKIHAEQIGIGRSPWELTLSAAWRDGAFVLAGVTYNTWDRLSARSFSCDVNLRTGDYAIQAEGAARQGKGPAQAIPLRDWTTDSPLPPVCDTALSAWWAE